MYQEEISKALVPLVKHFEFVLETKPNHSQGIESVSMRKRNVERQLLQVKWRMHKREQMI